jgi:hypothetical protein
MDPMSIIFGTLGVSGLFSATLDALDRISAAKSYGSDYHLFIAKVATERLRLSRWGRQALQNELMQDSEIQNAVCELLAWAIWFFEDSDKLRKRHRRPSRGFITFLPGRSSSMSMNTARPPAFNFPRDRVEKLQKEASALRKLKWAFSGKKKSEKLLQELAWFIDRLYALVPTARHQVQMSPPEPEVHEIITPPRPQGVEILQLLPLLPPAESDIGNVLHSSFLSGVMRKHIHLLKVESRIRRTRKCARRITIGTADSIRTNERCSRVRLVINSFYSNKCD